jgi:hypothetical protein
MEQKVIKVKKPFMMMLSLTISLCIVYSIPNITTIADSAHSSYYGIITLICFGIFTFIVSRALAITNKRIFVISSLGGLVFSFTMMIGHYAIAGKLKHPVLNMFFSTIGFSFLIAALIALILYYLPTISNKIYHSRFQIKFKSIFSGNLSYFFIAWSIIFVCYVPAFLAAFPGLYTYDAPSQMAQYKSGVITRFVPPLHTFYLGTCFAIGNTIFHSDTAGMAIYSITQMLMLSAAFAFCCSFLAKHKAPVIIQIISIAYFALFPLNQIFSICVTKDVTFTAAFLIVIILTIDMVLNPKSFFSSIILQFRYILLLLLMFSLRNNGFYVFILCVPLFLIVFRKYSIKISSVCLISILTWILITGPVYSALHIGKGNDREILSVPIQQLSKAVINNYSSFSNGEKKPLLIYWDRRLKFVKYIYHIYLIQKSQTLIQINLKKMLVTM